MPSPLPRWLQLAGGYEGLWCYPLQGPSDLSLEQLLDRRTRHVDHCAVCQKVGCQGGSRGSRPLQCCLC